MQISLWLITNCQLFLEDIIKFQEMKDFVLIVMRVKLVMNFITFFSAGRFHEQRKKYLKRYYWKNPNTMKMDQLFNCEKKTILFNLTKFCSYIMTHV